MTFRVGQKVVCVETWHRDGEGAGDEVGPISGEIYTIREIGIGLNRGYPDGLQVRLIEIRNPLHLYMSGVFEAAFRITRFRPVVERKTDISVFTKMLKPLRADA